uniref:Uncharacterized protein n=1 Tax=Rhizophora mucronata TaxID=61149 RepID=A0A2P2PFL6_RHIMU
MCMLDSFPGLIAWWFYVYLLR